MDTQIIIAIVVIVLIGVAAGAWFYLQRARSRRLREQFGPEYDRAVERMKDRELAEAALRDREKRVRRFDIVPLPAEESRQYENQWKSAQGRFVDDPKGAVDEANRLIDEVMRRRGYPVTDFEQSAADLSVDHPVVVENYRAAVAIARRNARGESETEELRRALVYYRTLFQELLESREPRAGKNDSPLSRAREGLASLKPKKGGLRA